jgi:methionyl-tRNA synthetase
VAAALTDYARAAWVRAEAGVAAAFGLIDAANGYIASTEPWALARDAARQIAFRRSWSTWQKPFVCCGAAAPVMPIGR